ncbi:sulfotransferase family protein [Paludisphaera rhizosphaerae]|uniref:sulfotransferase family protein n=1 Tax=Paludisphaera rhizosphaerae TaxID=2711216 RepID=UPI0013ED85AC|nr:sulfotransferase [Paludisphaera rhizosphaerae]
MSAPVMADQEIVIVSGLPRSGTSLMMQMLDQGGIEAVTDRQRTPDVDNPRGYYEFEIVKKIKEDASWLPETRGKVFKMVSQLLYDLPASETYRIVFMRRDFDEMLASQEKMLARLGRPSAPRDEIKRAFTQHLQRLFAWLEKQPNMHVLFVDHHDLVADPSPQVARINAFFGGRLDEAKMIEAVDPSLYRNRKGETAG